MPTLSKEKESKESKAQCRKMKRKTIQRIGKKIYANCQKNTCNGKSTKNEKMSNVL